MFFFSRCAGVLLRRPIGPRRIFDSTLIVLKPIQCQQAVSRLSQHIQFFSWR